MLRTRSRLAAGAFAVAAALIASPAMAHAAAPATAKVFLANMSLAPGASSTQDVFVFGSGQPRNVTLTIDLSSLPDHVTMGDPDGANCDRSGTTVTCQLFPDVDLDEADTGPQITLTADSQANVGDTGKIKLTVDSDDTEPFTSTSDVTVAEADDLSAGADVDASATAGKHVAAGLTVRNSGKNTVHGAYLVMFAEDAFRFATRYSNCVYVTEISEAYCEFDTDLAAGQTYVVSGKVDFQVSSDSQAPTIVAADVTWATPQDWADEKSSLNGLGVNQDGPHGSAAALQLVASSQASSHAVPPQTDVNPDDNFSEVTVHVTGHNYADYAAIGASASGNVGATVNVKVGLKNHGPAAIREGRAGNDTYSALVTFPKGVTTTAAPQNCYPFADGQPDTDHPGKPGAAVYECMATDTVAPGASVLLPFSLHIDKSLTDAKGSIVVAQPTESETQNVWDNNLANNKADIVINPSSDSGSLPVTGSNTFAIAGVGVLVVAAGVVLVWFGRRRKRIA